MSASDLTYDGRGVLWASTHNGSTLDTVASPSTSQNWSLDLLGNWTSDSGVSNGTEARTFNAQNQITGISGNTSGTPTYDNNGNLLTDGGLSADTFGYDAWNRMVKVSQSGSPIETRGYYADRSLGSSVDTCQSVTTRSYYSADWQVLEDDTQTGSGFPRPPFVVARQFVWGQGYIDALVERDDSSSSGSLGKSSSGLGRRSYAQQDANWNVTAITDTSGNVLERYVFDPYGQVSIRNPDWTGSGWPIGQYTWEHLFQGGRRDLIVNSLYDFRNRIYDVPLGVWMQKDPTGAHYADGMNLYQPDDGSPVTYVDPYGTKPHKLPPPTVFQGPRPTTGPDVPDQEPVPEPPVPPHIIVPVTNPVVVHEGESKPALFHVLEYDPKTKQIVGDREPPSIDHPKGTFDPIGLPGIKVALRRHVDTGDFTVAQMFIVTASGETLPHFRSIGRFGDVGFIVTGVFAGHGTITAVDSADPRVRAVVQVKVLPCAPTSQERAPATSTQPSSTSSSSEG